MSAINNGKPLAEIAPKSNISNSLMELAANIVPSRAAKEKKRKPFLNFFQILLAKPGEHD
jgi:Flp pilus assembly CpaE family ATPase